MAEQQLGNGADIQGLFEEAYGYTTPDAKTQQAALAEIAELKRNGLLGRTATQQKDQNTPRAET